MARVASSKRASRFGQLEGDPSRQQRDDELVEGDTLLGGEGDELFVECGRAPDEDSAVRVHAANNITRAIDIASSACDITPMTYTITTEADTRSKTRRTRTWTITSAELPTLRERNELDERYSDREVARYEAMERHLRIVGWNSSIGATVEVAA